MNLDTRLFSFIPINGSFSDESAKGGSLHVFVCSYSVEARGEWHEAMGQWTDLS